MAADPSYGLRLGASRDINERGLLGFLILNSPTLMDAVINLQRFHKVVREDGEFEIERIGRGWRSDSGGRFRRCAD